VVEVFTVFMLAGLCFFASWSLKIDRIFIPMFVSSCLNRTSPINHLECEQAVWKVFAAHVAKDGFLDKASSRDFPDRNASGDD